MFGNLHRIASRYIPQQTAQWFRFKNREPDERGHDQNQYYEPVDIRGSWQAVDTQDAQSMGFDSSSIYRRFYTAHDIKAIQRGTSPDFLVFNGKKYDVMGDADWYEQDGWKSVICIEVGAYDG
ncbi:hypothetical protein AB7200_08950 [Providencia alcalifaciens]|uniref:phage collar protein n=1 Tax=Providencia TaxID=586 RepID=UPI00065E9BBF|nr:MULTISPECIES: phage protein [Providencia]ELR5048335.1 hypothetical protein [Providencia rettgeri]MDH2321411.1 hypothetical protein [Providencia rettgeri]